MQSSKRRQLERAGWTIGDAGEFLGLSVEERRFIEVKLALPAGRRRRQQPLQRRPRAARERT